MPVFAEQAWPDLHYTTVKGALVLLALAGAHRAVVTAARGIVVKEVTPWSEKCLLRSGFSSHGLPLLVVAHCHQTTQLEELMAVLVVRHVRPPLPRCRHCSKLRLPSRAIPARQRSSVNSIER